MPGPLVGRVARHRQCHLRVAGYDGGCPVGPVCGCPRTRSVAPHGESLETFNALRCHYVAVVAEKKRVPHVVHIKKYGMGSVHKYEQVRQQERQVQRDLARQRRQGIISCSEYTAAALASNSRRVAAYHPGYLGPCSFAGDRFHAVMLTPHGGWWEWGHGGVLRYEIPYA